jgi:hypothetical protein
MTCFLVGALIVLAVLVSALREELIELRERIEDLENDVEPEE